MTCDWCSFYLVGGLTLLGPWLPLPGLWAGLWVVSSLPELWACDLVGISCGVGWFVLGRCPCSYILVVSFGCLCPGCGPFDFILLVPGCGFYVIWLLVRVVPSMWVFGFCFIRWYLFRVKAPLPMF